MNGSEFIASATGRKPEEYDPPPLHGSDVVWAKDAAGEWTGPVDGDFTKSVFHPRLKVMAVCFRPGCTGVANIHVLGGTTKNVYIACSECGLETKVHGSEENALDDWNSREEPQPEPLGGRDMGYYLMGIPKDGGFISKPVVVRLVKEKMETAPYLHVVGHGDYDKLVSEGYEFFALFLAQPDPASKPPKEVVMALEKVVASASWPPHRIETIRNWLDEVGGE
jgi:hypothetical protein